MTVQRKPVGMPVKILALVVLLGGMAIVSISRGDSGDTNDNPDALDQASVAFQNSPSRATIKGELDKVFDHFGMAKTDENYSRAASTLIRLRQRGQGRGCEACTEMAILSHIERSSGWETGMDFPEASAWSVEAMIAGDQ
ncbi:MAG: hypothetical protein M3406_15420 [Chloroflexota bacterium]|nr:hypothetical protein [Chloroflexota bacterium]